MATLEFPMSRELFRTVVNDILNATRGQFGWALIDPDDHIALAKHRAYNDGVDAVQEAIVDTLRHYGCDLQPIEEGE